MNKIMTQIQSKYPDENAEVRVDSGHARN